MRAAIVMGVACLLIAGPALPQSRLQFRSTEWVGLTTGQEGGAGHVETVDGIAKGPWFAGLGAGIDYCRFRSVPLFVSVTRDIALGKHDWLYLYLDGGKNAPWTGSGSEAPNSMIARNFGGGSYWAGGVGYLWGLSGQPSKAILVSAGYTMKKQSEDQFPAYPCTSPGCIVVHYQYLNQMWLFMIGFRF